MHRVVVDSLELLELIVVGVDCRRENEVASRTSIGGEWGVHSEEWSCACMGGRCTGRDAYPSWVPKSETRALIVSAKSGSKRRVDHMLSSFLIMSLTSAQYSRLS